MKMLMGHEQFWQPGVFHAAVFQEDELKACWHKYILCSLQLALSLNLKFSVSRIINFLPELIFLQFLPPFLAFQFPILKLMSPTTFLSTRFCLFAFTFEMGPCCAVQAGFKRLGPSAPLSLSLPCRWDYSCAPSHGPFSSLPPPGLSSRRITPPVKFPVYQDPLGVYEPLPSLIPTCLIPCHSAQVGLHIAPSYTVSQSPGPLSSCRNSCPAFCLLPRRICRSLLAWHSPLCTFYLFQGPVLRALPN